MSAVCDLCGKEFKNSQGLRGHKTFFHGIRKGKYVLNNAAVGLSVSNTEKPVILVTFDKRLGKLESAIENLLDITGVDELEQESYWNHNELPIVMRVEQIADQFTEQLKTLISTRVSQAELTPVCDRLEGLSRQLTSLNFSYISLFDKIGTLEKELNEKADQGAAISIEARVVKLEKA